MCANVWEIGKAVFFASICRDCALFLRTIVICFLRTYLKISESLLLCPRPDKAYTKSLSTIYFIGWDISHQPKMKSRRLCKNGQNSLTASVTVFKSFHLFDSRVPTTNTPCFKTHDGTVGILRAAFSFFGRLKDVDYLCASDLSLFCGEWWRKETLQLLVFKPFRSGNSSTLFRVTQKTYLFILSTIKINYGGEQ